MGGPRGRLRGVCGVGALSGALFLTVAAGALASAGAASAQAPRTQQVVPTPQQLQPSEQLPSPQARRRSDIFQPPEAGPCPLRDSPLTFTLASVTFTGADKIDLRRLEPAYAGQIGKTLPVAALCEIRDRATAILFRRGVLARVDIPEQRIADGKLTLQVTEARVASVRFRGDAGPSQARVEAILERLRGMAPFDLYVAERYLLLANDIPGVRVSAAIRPAAAGGGAVDLEVTVTRTPVQVAAEVQNYGSKTLGREAGLVRGDFNGFTPFGDHTGLILYSTADLREQRVVQVLEDLRPFDDGLILHGELSYARTRPGGELTPLDLHGDSLSATLSAIYPVFRKRSWNLNVSGGLNYVDEKTTFANAGGTLIDDKLRILFARADYDKTDVLFGVPYQGAVGVELRKGLDALGASRKGSSALSRSEGEADAFVARLDAHLAVQPLPLVELYGAVVAQDADRPLLTYEELAIGNLTIGRGYDPSSVSGDRGVSASVEARFGPFQPIRAWPWLRISPYGFYDVAYTKYIDTLGESATIHSAGGGFRLSLTRRLDLNVAYAHPFDKPTISAAAPPLPRVLAELNLRY